MSPERLDEIILEHERPPQFFSPHAREFLSSSYCWSSCCQWSDVVILRSVLAKRKIWKSNSLRSDNTRMDNSTRKKRYVYIRVLGPFRLLYGNPIQTKKQMEVIFTLFLYFVMNAKPYRSTSFDAGWHYCIYRFWSTPFCSLRLPRGPWTS